MLGRSPLVYPLKPKPRRPFWRRVALRFVFVLVPASALFGTVYLGNLEALRVDTVEVRGLHAASAVSPGDVERQIQSVMAGQRWLFFPKSNFFLLSSEGIENKLRQEFSQLSEVNVSKKFPNKLTVKLKERVLWGIYCQADNSPGGAAGRCFYLDERGVAYEDVSGYEGLLLPVISSGRAVVQGERAVESETLEFFKQARESLAAVNADLLSLTFATSTPADVRLSLAESWYVAASVAQPIQEWFEVLKTLLEKDIGERRGDLEYVDLRFGRKVFYKFRN